ncbi:hypothetical protein PILCRDRAFT_812552, partial [Piloderma croceum F 1598]
MRPSFYKIVAGGPRRHMLYQREMLAVSTIDINICVYGYFKLMLDMYRLFKYEASKNKNTIIAGSKMWL